MEGGKVVPGEGPMEELLSSDPAFIQSVLDHSPVGVLIFGLDGRIRFANRFVTDALGLTRRELAQRTYDDPVWRIVGVDGEPVEAGALPFARVLAERRPILGVRHAIVWPDGHRMQLAVSAAPMTGPDGAVTAVVAIVEDVTEREHAELVRRESEERFLSVLRASPMGVHLYRLEADGGLVFEGANPAADRLLGVDNARFVGRTIEEAFPPLAGTEIPARYREVAAHGRPWQARQVDYADDRIRGAFEVYAFRTAPGHVAVFFLDVGERVRAEAERARLEAQLLQAQKMEAVGRLAGGVAHDFNNLLTGIFGFAAVIRRRLRPGDPIAADLDEIEGAATRAAELTRQLLAFSRNQPIRPRVLDLNAAVQGSLRLLQRVIGEDVQLTFVPGTGLGRVRIDPGQIEQILVNLAVNARDAMPDGGRLTVETSSASLDEAACAGHPGARPGRFALLSVADSGAGIPGEVLPHVFEPFFTTKEGAGTGLGLSTVYGIAHQNGGAATVQSEVGVGTVFRVYLPETEEPLESPAAGGGERRAPRGTELVVLVEDEPALRALTQRMLEEQGYRVVAAGRALEAHRLADGLERPPALLVTDVVLPDENGRRLYEGMRARHPGLRVLYVSGYAAPVIAGHGILEPGTAFLQKPFTPEELARKVRAVLDG